MNILTKAFKHLRYFLRSKAVVLSYHRIATPNIDPWEIAVSAKNFEEQMQVLQKAYQVITPEQLADFLKAGKLKNNMVCITFDDGYQDNYFTARPILEKYNLPATIFIPVELIDEQKEFWWDELMTILFSSHNLPANLDILIGEKPFYFDLAEEAVFDSMQHQSLTSWIWYEKTDSKRAQLYLALWNQLRPLKHDEILKVLQTLKVWSSFVAPDDTGSYPMTKDQLTEIIKHPLFDIGVHTLTHPALAFHSKEHQYYEIQECKQKLEQISGRELNTIAYPYGIYNEDTIAVAEEIGMKIGFTTQGNTILTNDHPLRLPRCHVKNWNGEEFEKKLNFWTKGF